MQPLGFKILEYVNTNLDLILSNNPQAKLITPGLVDEALTSLDQFARIPCNLERDKPSLNKIKNSIKVIKESQPAGDALLPKLEELSGKVDNLLENGFLKEKFKAQSIASTYENITAPVRAIFSFLTESIVDGVNKMVYHGWASNVKDKKLKKSIENELLGKYQNWGKIAKSNAKTQEDLDQIDERLQIEEGLVHVAVENDPNLAKVNFLEKKGEETRLQMMAIGGKRVELESADGVKLDATYLSAQKFLDKLNNAQAKSVTFTFEDGKKFQGISLRKEQGAELIDLLENFKLISDDSTVTSYCLFQNPMDSSEVFLVERGAIDLYPTLLEVCDSVQGSIKHLDIRARISWEYSNLIQDYKGQNGVAILTSGNAGIYEMHKSEAMALLMRGMDVMLFNPRGYGKSEGKPSEEGSYLDIEAAYQYVKKERPKLPDSKMVAWCMCLSGGVGAHLVEKHPQMNLFLNQTYADFLPVLKDQISQKVTSYLKTAATSLKLEDNKLVLAFLNSSLTEIIFSAVRFIAPNYNVKDRLSKIEGRVCTLQALGDDLMRERETSEMNEIMKQHKIQHDKIQIPGAHSSNWVQAAVPVIKIKTAKGYIEAGLTDYLKVKVGDQNYYVPKAKVDQGEKIGRKTFKRESIDKHHEITVTTTTKDGRKISEEKIQAHELEITDGRDLIDKISQAETFKTEPFEWHWHWLGHAKINQFLENAQLGIPIIPKTA